MNTKVSPTPFKYLFEDGHIESVFKRKKPLHPEWEFYVPKTLDHPDLTIDFKAHKMVHKSCLKSTGANLYALDLEAIRLRRKENRNKGNQDDYDNWWQRNNLDGGFAYNGVTEDF